MGWDLWTVAKDPFHPGRVTRHYWGSFPTYSSADIGLWGPVSCVLFVVAALPPSRPLYACVCLCMCV